jgi:hypothetical protein
VTRLGGGQAEPPGEGRQAGQHRPLGAVQQLPRPVDHGPQRPLPRQARPRPAGQQGEPLIQPGIQLRGRHYPQPGRGQLQGERDAIQPSADPPHQLRGRLVPGQDHPLGRGAVGEQPDGLAGLDCPDIVVTGRGAQRGDPVHVLAVDAQRFAAGRQQRQVRAAAQQRVGELGAGIQDVLAVVQDHQQAAPADRIDQRAGQRAARLFPDAQHVRDSDHDQAGIA